MRNPLHPAEAARRHQALMTAHWNSRRQSACVDDGPMAGASSAPVGPKFSKADKLSAAGGNAGGGFLPGVRTVTCYTAAKAWAVSQGICTRLAPLDLNAVNRKRREMGLPPFALKAEA